MRIEQPIFIIGAGRTGSTVFHQILCSHPRTAWLSNVLNYYPHRPAINWAVLTAVDTRLGGSLLRHKIKPSECYDFWEYYVKGFRRPCRDLLAEDVTNLSREQIRSILPMVVTAKRDRLLVKLTGWPRMGFLHTIFEDARFVHIMRDGRAVANSSLNVDFWWGWGGPYAWRWGELAPAHKEEWERHNRSFVALAGIQWKILMDAVECAKKYVDSHRFCEIRYEDLCADPIGVLRGCVDFCELEWSRNLEAAVRRSPLKNTNNKWKKDLTRDQQNVLEAVLHDHLRKYGYQ